MAIVFLTETHIWSIIQVGCLGLISLYRTVAGGIVAGGIVAGEAEGMTVGHGRLVTFDKGQ